MLTEASSPRPSVSLATGAAPLMVGGGTFATVRGRL
jgi:hypothetical protein